MPGTSKCLARHYLSHIPVPSFRLDPEHFAETYAVSVLLGASLALNARERNALHEGLLQEKEEQRAASRLPEFLPALSASCDIEYDGQHQHQASDDVLEGNVDAHEVHAARQ